MPVEAPAAPVESGATPASVPAFSPAPALEGAAPHSTEPQAESSSFASQSIEDTIFKTLEEKRLAREKSAAAPGDTPAVPSDEEKLAEELTPAPGPQTEEKPAEQQLEQGPTFDLNQPEITSKWLDDLAKTEKIKFADDATRDQFFRAVREHGEFKKVAELFPDVESAQEAQTGAANWMAADRVFNEAHTPQGTVDFVRYLLDREQAQPILPNGQSVVRAMFDNMRAWDFQQYQKQFQERGDEEGLAALEVLRERVAPQATSAPELPPHLRQHVVQIQAREQDLSRREQEQQAQLRTQFAQSIAADLDQQIGRAVRPVLEKAAFSDAIQQACEERIYERILDVLDSNQLYKAQSQRLLAKGTSEEDRRAIVALKMKYFNTVAPQIVRQTIREFSSPVVKAQAERNARHHEQEQRSRNEPKGVAAPALAPPASSPAQFVSRAIADLTNENGGHRPSQEQIIERVVQLKQQTRRQAR